MPNNPHVDDASFFKILDEMDLSRLDRSKGNFSWEQRVYGEDRAAAEDAMRGHYASLKLQIPKFAWATSPASLWSAITMLKTFPYKQALIDSLIPVKGLVLGVTIEPEAKRSMLAAIIDDAVMVTMGAPIAPMLKWKTWNSPPRVHQAIHDADRLITSAARASNSLGRSATPAGWSDAVLYPELYSEGKGHLAAQAFCVLPYARICWMCLPPMFMKTDPIGNLHCEDGPAAAWSDGYSITRVHEEEKLALPSSIEEEFGIIGKENATAKLLNGAVSGLIKKRLEGK